MTVKLPNKKFLHIYIEKQNRFWWSVMNEEITVRFFKISIIYSPLPF